MNREFKDAAIIRMSELLRNHVINTSPNTGYADDEIVVLLRELITIINNPELLTTKI